VSTHALVLAAGLGRRMGGSKHLRELEGRPLLAHVVEALLGLPLTGVTGVLRPGDRPGMALLEELGAGIAIAESVDEGRAASVRAGVRAAPRDADLLFALADQPFLRAEDFAALLAALAPDGPGIVHASYDGQRGSPVLFSARYRAELLALRGADGGRAVIAAHPEDTLGIELDPERGRDVDRPEDLG